MGPLTIEASLKSSMWWNLTLTKFEMMHFILAHWPNIGKGTKGMYSLWPSM